MGQPLPLPERIPKPNPDTIRGRELLGALKQAGITIDASPGEYVRYTLPHGWRMVDDSWRQDLPNFYIVDNTNMLRFSVTGAWKGSYDNELNLKEVNPPRQFEPQNNKTMIPSETGSNAMDPLHRPSPELTAERQPDYTS